MITNGFCTQALSSLGIGKYSTKQECKSYKCCKMVLDTSSSTATFLSVRKSYTVFKIFCSTGRFPEFQLPFQRQNLIICSKNGIQVLIIMMNLSKNRLSFRPELSEVKNTSSSLQSSKSVTSTLSLDRHLT